MKSKVLQWESNAKGIMEIVCQFVVLSALRGAGS